MERLAVAVVGASEDRRKFGNKAVRAYLAQGYTVYPVNPHARSVEGLPCYPSISALPEGPLSRILMYVPPEIGIGLLEEIQARRAEEVWFNPGSDNAALRQKADELGLEIIRACGIIDIGAMPG